MKSDRDYPVAIVGGGFSGTMVAAELARRGIRSVLIDGSGRAGNGIAYSTKEPAHLLNVRAEGMSAWAGDPAHFARRFEAEGGHSKGFAQRRLFGRYLREILDEAVASGCANVEHSFAQAADRSGDGWAVDLDDGRTVTADALVLASGNQDPAAPTAQSSAGERFIANPWGEAAQAAVRDLARSDGDALLIGTGLTMVDLVLSLDSAGYQGRILAVSRRGLIPRSHADFVPSPVEYGELPAGDLRALGRWLRRRSAETGWRAAIDGLRPHSHALWQSLELDQQRRFLRHARPWWDVHRHRIAPEVAATVARMIGDGRLEVMAGRIDSIAAQDGGLDVSIRRRGAREARPYRFAYAFNCTGPLHAMTRTSDPLLRSLFDRGHARPDALDISLDVDRRSRVAGGEHLWALGPLTKGLYWEIIAVPDIRGQAAAVAEDIAGELGG